jgi:hypothetical protein
MIPYIIRPLRYLRGKRTEGKIPRYTYAQAARAAQRGNGQLVQKIARIVYAIEARQ